jgi:hypothetical protein
MFKKIGLFLDQVTFFSQNLCQLEGVWLGRVREKAPGIRQVRLFSGTLTRRLALI